MSCCGQIAKGAIGLTKAALQIDRASDEVIRARRDACRECEFATRDPERVHLPTKGLTKLMSRCVKCGCFIAAKSVNASEKCPEGKWGSGSASAEAMQTA